MLDFLAEQLPGGRGRQGGCQALLQPWTRPRGGEWVPVVWPLPLPEETHVDAGRVLGSRARKRLY